MKKFLFIDGAMTYLALPIFGRKILLSDGVVLDDSAVAQPLATSAMAAAQ